MILSLSFTLGGCVWLFADDFEQVVNKIQEALVVKEDGDNIVPELDSDLSQANFPAANPTPGHSSDSRFLPTELVEFNGATWR